MSRYGKRWIRTWDPRAKIIAAFGFLFGVISLQSPVSLIVCFFAICIIVIGSGFPWKRLFKKLIVPAPFLAVMTLPILFNDGWVPASANVLFASSLLLKAIIALFVMILVVYTQPLERLFSGIAQMKLPQFVVTILFLSYRYIHLFGLEWKQTMQAMKTRSFQPAFNVATFRMYGQLFGALIVKAFDLADQVQHALNARSFQGSVYFAETGKITKTDLMITFVAWLAIALLIAVERSMT